MESTGLLTPEIVIPSSGESHVFAANVYQQVRFSDSGRVHRTPETGDELRAGNKVELSPVNKVNVREGSLRRFTG